MHDINDKYGNTAFMGRKSIEDLVRMAEQPFTPEFNFEEVEDDSCVCSF